MTYTVDKIKTISGDCFVVVNTKLDINERWVFEPYLLNIEPNEEGDIVIPFLDFLVNEFKSVNIGRGSIIDSQRSCFTGMSTIEISFSDESEALDYAMKLNSSLGV